MCSKVEQQLINDLEEVIETYFDGYEDLNDVDTRDLAENIAALVSRR